MLLNTRGVGNFGGVLIFHICFYIYVDNNFRKRRGRIDVPFFLSAV